MNLDEACTCIERAGRLIAEKKPEDQLFDTMDATDLNKKLKDLMDGLSVKVFRTYNASITLDDLLSKHSSSSSVEEKKADYDRANKEVPPSPPLPSPPSPPSHTRTHARIRIHAHKHAHRVYGRMLKKLLLK